MIDMTEVMKAVITLVVLAVTYFLVPYLKQKVSAERLAEIQLWVSVAVEAAEMLYTGSGRGSEKKDYVLKFLHDRGYTLDMGAIENMIEAAVLEMKNAMAQ